MSDKTINGIDVSGAELYEKNVQLQKENEELKQQLEIDKNQINYFIEENEELKEKIKNF